MKKIILFILTIAIFAGILPVVPIYAAKAECVVDEVFDDYAFNSQILPSSIKMMSGLNTRIVERKGTDKALYSEMYGNSVKITVPLEKVYDKTVFTYDIKIDGKVQGNILDLKSGNALFRYSDAGGIILDTNKKIGGYISGKWKSYAVAVDFKAGTYDLYVDGKRIFQNRYFYQSPKAVNEFSFVFSPVNDDEKCAVAIDNLRVYEGSKILSPSSFEKKIPSSETENFVESTDKVVYDKVYVDSNGKEGISTSFAIKENTLAEWSSVPGENRDSLHFIKEGTQDVYASIQTSMSENSMVFVIECDVYPVRMENSNINLCTMIGPGVNSQIMKMYPQPGNVMIIGNETSCGSLPNGQWSRVSVAVNLILGTCDGYVNGVLKASGATLQNGGCIPSQLRVGITGSSSAGYNECYMRNYKIYEGSTLREFSDEDIAADTSEFESILEDNEAVKGHLSHDTVFATSNSKCYINKSKRDYSEFSAYPFTDKNGIYYVPSDIIAEAFSLEETKENNSLTLGGKYTLTQDSTQCATPGGTGTLEAAPFVKDGVFFIPLLSFCKNILNKYLYVDELRYILISNEPRNYTNDRSVDYEVSDSIHKYIHYDRPTADQVYNDMKQTGLLGKHPKLLATKEEFAKLLKKLNSSQENLEIYKEFIGSCENYMNKPLMKYEKPDGLRLYASIVSAAVAIETLGIGYQLTGDKKYAERAWQELENILSWDDWNCDAHFLDSGEAMWWIAVGYDCIYEYLSPERKKHFNKRYQELYLDYIVGTCTGTSKFTLQDSRNRLSNWGAVCGMGMLHGALILIDEEPEDSLLTKKCKFVVSQIIQSLEYPMGQIFPVGATAEGFGYWDYYFSSLTKSISTLKRLCGKDYGLLSAPGYSSSLQFALYCQSHLGPWAFSECATTHGVILPATMNLYAQMTGDIEAEKAVETLRPVFNTKTSLLELLWEGGYAPSSEINYPLHYYAPIDGLCVAKSSWDNKDGIYLAAIGGYCSHQSNHQDKGSFLFDALDERWFYDLGVDNRNVTVNGLTWWDPGFKYFVYTRKTEGHNCLVINPSYEDMGQDDLKSGETIRFDNSDRGSIFVYDLTEVYGERTAGYQRGFYLCDERDAVMVQDEVVLPQKSDIYWFAHTKAKIDVQPDGKSAILEQNGKKIKVEFYSNLKNFTIEDRLAEPFDERTYYEGENSREGVHKLTFAAEGVSGEVTISAKIIPLDENFVAKPLEYKPIAEWEIPEGKLTKPELSSIKMNGTTIEGFSPNVKSYIQKMPYGSVVPRFEATAASDNCRVEITQPPSLLDECVITVTNDIGITAVYRIRFELEAVITNNLRNIAPEVGLPEGSKPMRAASVFANHEPQADHLAGKAIDNDFATSWTSDVDSTYIELDLGEVREFDGIALSFLIGDTRKYRYEILYSEDKENYTRVFIGESSGKTAEFESLKIGGKARYVRFIGHFNTDSDWNNLSEFHVYKNN